MTFYETEHVFNKWVKHDNSFLDRPAGLGLALEIFFGSRKYSQLEAREIWHLGVKEGISLGLNHASLEGRKIQLDDSAISQKNKDFIQKYRKLAYEYGCAIQYNAEQGGMCVVDVDWGKPIKRFTTEELLLQQLDSANDKLNFVMDFIKKENPEMFETLQQSIL